MEEFKMAKKRRSGLRSYLYLTVIVEIVQQLLQNGTIQYLKQLEVKEWLYELTIKLTVFLANSGILDVFQMFPILLAAYGITLYKIRPDVYIGVYTKYKDTELTTDSFKKVYTKGEFIDAAYYTPVKITAKYLNSIVSKYLKEDTCFIDLPEKKRNKTLANAALEVIVISLVQLVFYFI